MSRPAGPRSPAERRVIEQLQAAARRAPGVLNAGANGSSTSGTNNDIGAGTFSSLLSSTSPGAAPNTSTAGATQTPPRSASFTGVTASGGGMSPVSGAGGGIGQSATSISVGTSLSRGRRSLHSLFSVHSTGNGSSVSASGNGTGAGVGTAAHSSRTRRELPLSRAVAADGPRAVQQVLDEFPEIDAATVAVLLSMHGGSKDAVLARLAEVYRRPVSTAATGGGVSAVETSELRATARKPVVAEQSVQSHAHKSRRSRLRRSMHMYKKGLRPYSMHNVDEDDDEVLNEEQLDDEEQVTAPLSNSASVTATASVSTHEQDAHFDPIPDPDIDAEPDVISDSSRRHHHHHPFSWASRRRSRSPRSRGSASASGSGSGSGSMGAVPAMPSRPSLNQPSSSTSPRYEHERPSSPLVSPLVSPTRRREPPPVTLAPSAAEAVARAKRNARFSTGASHSTMLPESHTARIRPLHQLHERLRQEQLVQHAAATQDERQHQHQLQQQQRQQENSTSVSVSSASSSVTSASATLRSSPARSSARSSATKSSKRSDTVAARSSGTKNSRHSRRTSGDESRSAPASAPDNDASVAATGDGPRSAREMFAAMRNRHRNSGSSRRDRDKDRDRDRDRDKASAVFPVGSEGELDEHEHEHEHEQVSISTSTVANSGPRPDADASEVSAEVPIATDNTRERLQTTARWENAARRRRQTQDTVVEAEEVAGMEGAEEDEDEERQVSSARSRRRSSYAPDASASMSRLEQLDVIQALMTKLERAERALSELQRELSVRERELLGAVAEVSAALNNYDMRQQRRYEDVTSRFTGNNDSIERLTGDMWTIRRMLHDYEMRRSRRFWRIVRMHLVDTLAYIGLFVVWFLTSLYNLCARQHRAFKKWQNRISSTDANANAAEILQQNTSRLRLTAHAEHEHDVPIGALQGFQADAHTPSAASSLKKRSACDPPLSEQGENVQDARSRSGNEQSAVRPSDGDSAT